MKSAIESIDDPLERVAAGVVRDQSAPVDQNASFPEDSIKSLAEAGLLGAASSTEVGGLGLGHRGAATVVRRVARECGSTGMVACMHFSGTAVLEAFASAEVRRKAASGEHLSTLAFSEAGSRSHFWAPLGTAEKSGEDIVLNARKSWVTSAAHAAAYVWSSRPVEADGMSTLWLVPSGAEGLSVGGPFDGLGLRGNDSTPVTAENVRVPASTMLTPDGGGFDAMLGVVLPMFQICTTAFSVGLMEAAVERTAVHASGARHEHLDSVLADLPTIRSYIAQMKIKTDLTAALLEDTLAAVEAGRADATLRVLESKAAGGETALEVLGLAMRVCGGAAFRKEVGIQRIFRDAQASAVMGPTSDVLYDFIGKAVCGMELF